MPALSSPPPLPFVFVFFGLLLFSSSLVRRAAASAGDRSIEQNNCVDRCTYDQNCSDGGAFAARQSRCERLLGWTCIDDCRYTCMWQTVEQFVRAGVDVPQFHGKWPFIRLCGVQEPASVLFSLLNLLSHAVMLRRFLRAVPTHAPMFAVWTAYALTAINAWLCSIVFHARDLHATEKMDYLSAFAFVVFSLCAFCFRLLSPHGGWRVTLPAAAAVGLIAIAAARHVYFMAFVHFDYGYNMLVNVSLGVFNSGCWIVWCGRNWLKLPHVRKAAFSVVAVNAALLLELFDFAPIWWIFDAHSLWHLATAPLPAAMYQFIIDDTQHLMAERTFIQRKNV